MGLKVAFVIVCLCALAITSTEAGIPKCCITTKRYIPKRVLQNVQYWDEQNDSGACDIHAVILRVKNMRRPICAHPKLLQKLQWLRSQNERKAIN